MSERDDLIALVEDLLASGRPMRGYEARALRDGLNERASISGSVFVALSASQIGERRKFKGISQKAVADACGVSIQAVSQWENGRTVPSSRHYGILNDLLGTASLS